MNPSSGSPDVAPGLEWLADLTFEHEGQVAARLRSGASGCVFEIVDRRGLWALGRLPLKEFVTRAPEGALARFAGLLPEQFDLSLSGVPIGRYEPAAPLNWLSRRLGLPFGRLTIDQVAFAQACLLGGS